MLRLDDKTIRAAANGNVPVYATGAPPDCAGLLDQIRSLVSRYVVLTEAQAVAVALWTVHTHTFDAAEATPYLSVTSAEKQSGKTRLLEVLDLLVSRPWFTGRVTPAVLARKIDAERPTLLLDESDAAFSGEKEYAETLRGVLNTGYRRSGKASVCVGQGSAISYKDFSTFSPKAIAGIGKLPDTIADRSIPVRLRRRAPNQYVERFREREVKAETEPLHHSLEELASLAMDVLWIARPSLPEDMPDRAADVWEPLLAIADLAGGEWPERARSAALELSGTGARDDESIGILLLADLRAVFGRRGTDRISSADLIGDLIADPESPWVEWRAGSPISQRGVAKILATHDISSRTIRLETGGDAEGLHARPVQGRVGAVPTPG